MLVNVEKNMCGENICIVRVVDIKCVMIYACIDNVVEKLGI